MINTFHRLGPRPSPPHSVSDTNVPCLSFVPYLLTTTYIGLLRLLYTSPPPPSQPLPLSHAHQNRVEPGLTRSHGPLNPGSTWVTRCESGLRGVKASYECIVNRNSLSLQFPAISFQMNDSCISPRQLFAADTQ